MNHTRVLLALLLFLPALSGTGHAQAPEQLFAEGNDAYQRGDLAKAIGVYEAILRNGYVAGDLYFNLGNAYYRSGDIARALLNYERARRLMPGDEDLRHNIQLAGSLITDKIEPTPRLFLWEWWDGLKEGLTLRTATWIAYGCYVILLGAVALLLVGRTYRARSIGIWSLTAAVGLLGLSLVLLSAKVSEIHRTDEAVVMQPVVAAKNSPDEKSTDAFVLHAGLKVQLIDQLGTWVKIRLADGKVGWIPSGNAERI